VLYPLLLLEVAPRLLGARVAAEDLRLVYWFTGDALGEGAGRTEVFAYSEARRAEDLRFLGALLSRLLTMEVAVWPLTSYERHCRLCQYRSLCDRGRVAGALSADDPESWPDVEELSGIIDSAAALDEYIL
jgi:RecB family exonuclease